MNISFSRTSKANMAVRFSVFILVAISQVGSSFADTLLVPGDFPTIQEAINYTNDGDLVLVAPGVYSENINFIGKAITVTSSEGPDTTIIDGGGIDSVVIFESNEGSSSVLSGFTVRNGGFSFTGDGGGIRIEYASPTITNNYVINNSACFGAGIYVHFGSPIINQNIIRNNNQAGCGGSGGGISIGGDSNVQIIGNVISNNSTGGDGGGIDLFAAGGGLILDNIIAENTSYSGGGISMINDVDDLVIMQNLLINNNGVRGGGIAWWSGPPAAIVNNTIADNSASYIGSGIWGHSFVAFTTEALIANNIIVGIDDQTVIDCEYFSTTYPPIIESNDVYSPLGELYGVGCVDQTGLNGNISANPLFIDPQYGDYNLDPDSPVIDSGSNTITTLPLTDLNGNDRIVDGDGDGLSIVDIGAYELQPEITLIDIDILPKMEVNSINLNNKGSIQVAILSASDFHAYNEVNPDSVEFGPIGAVPTRYKVKDVNRDGLPDMVFYFKLKETGIECGDTEATLIGETYNGNAFKGTDSIVTKGCGQ